MNSYSEARRSGMRIWRALLPLVLWLFASPPPAHALNVHAVYRSACERALGVILRVDRRDIHLLGLDGRLQTIPRHEIVSLLYYPVSQLPLAAAPRLPNHPPLRVQTLQDGRLVELVHGWPVDYSDSKISFMLPTGDELVISRDSIWALTFDPLPPSEARAVTREGPRLVFAHPQAAGFCAEPEAAPEAQQVFAQQLLNDPIVIKRELDRLKEGHEKILEYEGDQKFYPVPQVYENRTSLGLWVSFLSRYGASKGRPANLIPLLVDQFSNGPFGYQHTFLTGSTPGPFLLHHEPQSQIYYRFKAAYFHSSVMFDPNLVLTGPSKYQWRPEDLEGRRLDDRTSETLALEFGFDFGPLALQFWPVVLAQSSIKIGDVFDRTSELNLWRAGPLLTFRSWQLEILGGTSGTNTYYGWEAPGENAVQISEGDWRVRYARVNLGLALAETLSLEASFIYRGLVYSGTEYIFDTPGPGNGTMSRIFTYDSDMTSWALIASYRIGRRFTVAGNASLETLSSQTVAAGVPSKASGLFPKLSLYTSFTF